MQDVSNEYRYVSSIGATFSPAERACLQASLPLIRDSYSLARVVLWGRMEGVHGDYLIAYGLSTKTSLALPKQFFVSGDGGLQWELLPSLSNEERGYCAKIQGMLSGQRGFQYSVVKDASLEPEGGDEEGLAAVPASGDNDEDGGNEEDAGDDEKPKQSRLRRISEFTRLAYMIECIDQDTAVVPRGFYVLTATENVEKNSLFEGLSRDQALSLKNYFHFRASDILEAKSLLEKEHLSKSLDFLPSLAEDVPPGCWAMHFDSITNCLSLRSLLWPGYVAYHVLDSNIAGGCYVGTGLKNMDLGFML